MATRSGLQLEQIKKNVPRSKGSADSTVVRSDEREKGVRIITEWFESKAKRYLKICDPYFGPEDLEILNHLPSSLENFSVVVLTSRKHQIDLGLTFPFEDEYRASWELLSSGRQMPRTEVVIVGTESGGYTPIHDRWWVTEGSGIELGTSLRDLGVGRTSKVSLMDPAEAADCEMEMNRYMSREQQEHNGEKLRYWLFTL